jgi:hypothetical protein
MAHLPFRSALLLMLLTGPAVRAADACFCAPGPACSVAWRADAVFIATAIDNVEERVGGNLFWTVQRLQVTRTLRGTATPLVTMVPLGRPEQEQIAESLSHAKTYAGRNSCDYSLRLGEEYLVYATRGADGRWTTSVCSGTKPLAEATADLEYFAGLSVADPTGRVYGPVERTILDADDPTKTRVVPASGIAVALSTGSSRTTVTTNAQGKLDVRLRPGEYSIAPVVPEGVRVFGGPNPITVPARGCAPVHFSLISNGRIEGQVVREDGSAVPRVSVGVIPITMPAGTRPVIFTIAPFATTDERGRFRIDAILPGTYLLAVNPYSRPDARSPSATTFFPAGDRSDAVAIEVGDGERKTGYTITIKP